MIVLWGKKKLEVNTLKITVISLEASELIVRISSFSLVTVIIFGKQGVKFYQKQLSK